MVPIPENSRAPELAKDLVLAIFFDFSEPHGINERGAVVGGATITASDIEDIAVDLVRNAVQIHIKDANGNGKDEEAEEEAE